MNKLSDVLRFEIFRSLKKKSFWFTALSIPILIVIIISISIVSSNHANKNSQQQAQSITKTSKIAILDDTGLINTKLLAKLNIMIEPSQQAGINAVETKKIDAFFFYPKNVTKTGIDVYSQDKGITLSSPYSTEAIALLKSDVIAKAGAATRSTQVVQLLEADPAINTTTYQNGKEVNSDANLIAPGLFMLGFLALIILTSYLMITSTTEEKENRVAEILLTSVKSRSLIIGKILSIFALGTIQVIVIIVPVVIAVIVFKSRISLPGGVSLSHIPINAAAVTFGALFLVGGLVLFTGALVGLSALFPSAQEAGRYLGIAMIWAYVPLYTLGYVVSSPHAMIVSIFTYFPLTAPTTALLRNAVGALSISEALASVAIVYVSATLAILFAIRAFRYGAMEYGRRISIKEIFH